MLKQNNKKIWLVDVNMGYGHQRTAFPLKTLAFNKEIISANDYHGIPEKDKGVWKTSRSFYEFISKFKRVPLIGKITFSFYDRVQRILKFYPKRDLSSPNFAVKQIFSLVKKDWGKHLIKKLSTNPLPLVSSFFTPVFMAEIFNYPAEIFCIICDADISRAWVSTKAKESRIKYFAPTQRVVERLKLYGVRKKNIFLTGFPLPLENIGNKNLNILKKDLGYRLLNLDPDKKYFKRYKVLIDKYIGNLPKKQNHLLTIMFSVGGAGAQKEIGIKIVRSLIHKIREKKVNVVLSAGTKREVRQYFSESLKRLKLDKSKNVKIIFNKNIEKYFKEFNETLRKTDILWTKPSELSFYTGLGLPIILAPSIGSQEHFNREWLLKLGSAIPQKNPAYTNEWLFDLLEDGWLAEAAMQGFVEAEKLGTYNIKKIVSK